MIDLLKFGEKPDGYPVGSIVMVQDYAALENFIPAKILEAPERYEDVWQDGELVCIYGQPVEPLTGPFRVGPDHGPVAIATLGMIRLATELEIRELESEGWL